MLTHTDAKAVFYLYLVLTVLSSIWLIVTIVTPLTLSKEAKKKKKKVKRIVKYIKWAIRFGVIIFSFVYAAKYNEGLLKILLAVGSLLLLFGQIIFELICRAIERYYKLLMHSFVKDAERLTEDNDKSLKGKFINKIFKLKDKSNDLSSKHHPDEKTVRDYNDIIDEYEDIE